MVLHSSEVLLFLMLGLAVATAALAVHMVRRSH